MDIKGTHGIGRVDPAKKATTDSQRGETPEAVAPREGTDQLTLTPLMRRLMDAARASGDGPPVDRARVESIRDAIASGGYEIDAERIAAALLKTEHEMGN
jgi:negative regulator of flagellin synthesis FlgM